MGEDYETLKARLEKDFFLIHRSLLKHYVMTLALVLGALGLGGFGGAWQTGRAAARAWMESQAGKEAQERLERLTIDARSAKDTAQAAEKTWSGIQQDYKVQVASISSVAEGFRTLPTFQGFSEGDLPLQVLQGKQEVGNGGNIQPAARGQQICFRSDCQPAFAASPTLLASATFAYSNEGTTDMFTVQAKHVTPSYFRVDWRRLDASGTSGGGLTINWIAIGTRR